MSKICHLCMPPGVVKPQPSFDTSMLKKCQWICRSWKAPLDLLKAFCLLQLIGGIRVSSFRNGPFHSIGSLHGCFSTVEWDEENSYV